VGVAIKDEILIEVYEMSKPARLIQSPKRKEKKRKKEEAAK
jgi:hypothetical protein